MKSYITGNWGHIFPSSQSERDLRFVLDTNTNKVIAMQIRTGSGYQHATKEEMADVEDSLLNANEDAIKHPEDWGLVAVAMLPDWANDLMMAS